MIKRIIFLVLVLMLAWTTWPAFVLTWMALHGEKVILVYP